MKHISLDYECFDDDIFVGLKSHVNSIIEEKPYLVDSFDDQRSMDDSTVTWEFFCSLRTILNEHGYDLLLEKKTYDWDNSFGWKGFGIQRYTESVGAHTDDFKNYFCMVVVNKRIKSGRYNYCQFYSEGRWLNEVVEGDVVIFNQRKEHALLLTKVEVDVCLFEVKKIRKNK